MTALFRWHRLNRVLAKWSLFKTIYGRSVFYERLIMWIHYIMSVVYVAIHTRLFETSLKLRAGHLQAAS
jgi:hypothetical protein